MWIAIEANDVLMFRDSKPFAAGQNFVARSTFPPNPQVMTGAVRATAITEAGVSFLDFRKGQAPPELHEKIGNLTQLGKLHLRGPYVCRIGRDKSIDILFPIPQDVLYDEGQNLFVTMQPSKKLGKSMKTTAPFPDWTPLALPALPLNANGEDYSFENVSGWLRSDNFQEYLANHQIDAKQALQNEAVFELEGHMGLGLDYSRRAADERRSLLYRAEFVRPYDAHDGDYQIRLLVETNDNLLARSGFMTLGGESRFCAYETVDYQYPLKAPKQHAGRLKIVLLSPAFFKGGWQPNNHDKSPWSPWLGKDAKLVSLAAATPTIISGWDMARNQPKPLYRYMPAGSVYYFEDATLPSIPFTESVSALDAGAMGFGEYAVGTWDYLD